MGKIKETSIGQPINFFIVTDGTIDNIDYNSTKYPNLSIIFVPINNSDDTPYKMLLTDENGKVHQIT